VVEREGTKRNEWIRIEGGKKVALKETGHYHRLAVETEKPSSRL